MLSSLTSPAMFVSPGSSSADERAGTRQVDDSHLAFSVDPEDWGGLAGTIRASGDLRARLESCCDRPYEGIELFED